MSTKRTLEPRVGRSFTAIAPNKKDESNISLERYELGTTYIWSDPAVTKIMLYFILEAMPVG
ncbi:hypothetical protein RMCBS344292_12798 [Rhizopus microsporus]|nr:hypothetical protein RMCBS344292_12798 [Rhizopus microsporus]